ncbi:MAG: TetR family transcriptional regulator [Thalassotalea sp.]
MVRKTKEETAETRSMLLDAAETVFFTKGYSQTTLMDVAGEAGMTRGAIYWHFKNKVDLFVAMVERVKLPLDSLGEAAADDNEADPIGKLKQFSYSFLKQLTEDKQRLRVFSILFHKFEQNGEAEELELRQKQAYLDCTDRIMRGFSNAVAKKQLPENLDVKKAAIAKHAFFAGIVNNWLFMPESFDLAEMHISLVDNFFFMLENSPHLRMS